MKKYPEILDPQQRYCLVCDNATIHHVKKLKTLRSFLKIFFLAPYSPFLNPIEETFALVKFNYRRSLLKNDLKLEINIKDAFKQVLERHYYAFYYHTVCFFNDCMNSL